MVKDNSYNIAPLQDKMLELLKKFIEMCDSNGLAYYACGGTCIGAVRHDGFIPWDDDLDVFMPRPDYEKLWELCNGVDGTGKYMLCRTTKEKNYHHRVMQLVDLNTTFIVKRNENEDIEHGVYIDIIPLDARAKSRLGRLEQIADCILFSVFNIQCLPEFNGGRFERFAISLLLKLIRNPHIRYKIWSSAERRMTNYCWDDADEIIELTTAFKNLKKYRPKEWFAEPVKHKFEDIEINLPTCFLEYLKQGFGDYMGLPPVEDRHPRHNLVHMDLDNTYKIYSGKYYNVE